MIVFFPTYARRRPGEGGWRATVAGMVSRPLPPRSPRRRLGIAVLRRLLSLDETDVDSEIFRRRVEWFLFQRVAGQRVRIAVGDRIIDAGHSDKTGHFRVEFDLDDAEVAGTAGQLAYAAVPDDASEPPVTGDTGSIHLVAPEGVSVISDIDDTVKVSNVANRRELLRNTLVRDFMAVPGMPGVYRDWRSRDVAFHYVSASPWQLSRGLSGFLAEAGLPAGSMHLKLFRLKDSTPLGRLPSRKRSKRRVIEQIMADFPGRRFLLVGDSGERDPEVYAAVRRRRPQQVTGIAIRRVEARSPAWKVQARLAKLGDRLPAGSFHVFETPEELAPLLPDG